MVGGHPVTGHCAELIEEHLGRRHNISCLLKEGRMKPIMDIISELLLVETRASDLSECRSDPAVCSLILTEVS